MTAISEIERLRITDIEGWMETPELEWLYERGREASDALEIGTFMGRSACAIMAGMRAGAGGRLICVDMFDGRGTIRHEECAKHEPGWLRDTFVDHAMSRGFSGMFSTITGDSHDPEVVSLVPDHSVDFLFIDGSHDYESVSKDIALWTPKVAEGGVIAGHDFHPDWPGVVKAVEEAFPGCENPVVGIWAVEA